MNARVMIPVLLAVFLLGSVTTMGQTDVDKKIQREMRKIEKHTKKLQELQGENFIPPDIPEPEIDEEEIARIREEVLAEKDMAMEKHREAMESYREAMEEYRQQMEEKRSELNEKLRELREKNQQEINEWREQNEENLLDLREDLEELGDLHKRHYYYYKTPEFQFKRIEPYVFEAPNFKFDMPALKGGVYSLFTDQDVLNIEKNLDGETSSADFTYEVKKGVTGLAVVVNGSIESGKVVVGIKKPDGSLFNQYTLSPLANVNWHQNLRFEDEEESSYLGKWTVTVSADQAKGKYDVRINMR
jgi:hypothetical protein